MTAASMNEESKIESE